jgi:predicted nucleic acid-binding protein
VSEVFADTFYWIAIVDPRDQWRRATDLVASRLGEVRLVTTEEVLTDVLAFFAGRGPQFRESAATLARDLESDPSVDVIPQTHESFPAGLDLYQGRADKGYSLVDCISMATMSERGITDVLSGDQHFRQEGFVPLIDPDAA